ncbi:hypothetical protein [Methanoregula sp.]|uniref:hypothetical protein n=1 Tax=Methanoregula sp. TaxID=2052170 RepID=UPI00356265BA
MPKNTHPASSDSIKSSTEKKSTTLHTCACGETHENHEEGISHRDECTSPQKFGNSCCCGSGTAAKEARTRCGHGPRCQ